MKMSTIIVCLQFVGVGYLISEVFPFSETPLAYGLACLLYVVAAVAYDAATMLERK
jgi:hypothetical protein